MTFTNYKDGGYGVADGWRGVVLGGSGPRTDGYVVNNQIDRFRPLRIGLWDPSK